MLPDMYQAHFHIKENPFALTPDPRYLYMSRQHQEALAHLLYGMTQGGGFVQLTGEVGTGKTTICRSLLEQVPEEVDIAIILNPRQTAVELVASICDELRIDYPKGTESVKVLVDRLNRYLLDNHAGQRRTTLIIDEAQNLSSETLEQIRLLTNLETTTQKLLQIILIGQPELQKILDRPEMRQLAQRITARYHLTPLSREETLNYIKHRLKVAGLKDPVFTSGALRAVCRRSRGVPRLINILCDRALLGAYARQQKSVSRGLVHKAYSEIKGEIKRPQSRRIAGWVVAVFVLALLGAGWPFIPWELPGHRPIPKGPGNEPLSLSVAPRTSGPKDVRGRTAGKFHETPMGLQGVSVPGRAGGAGQGTDEGAGKNILETGKNVLDDLLREGGILTDKETAFMALFRCWNVEYGVRGGKKPCERAEVNGLRCIPGRGSWAMIMQHNRPVMLELIGEFGQSRYVAVTGLGDKDLTLDFGDRKLTLPRTDIDPYWPGEFVFLWKPPQWRQRFLKKGVSGPDVVWLRKVLARVEGTSSEGDPTSAESLFDTGLKRRIMAFQRAHGLKADGVVGERTLIQLNTAMQDPAIPLLEPVNPQGVK